MRLRSMRVGQEYLVSHNSGWLNHPAEPRRMRLVDSRQWRRLASPGTVKSWTLESGMPFVSSTLRPLVKGENQSNLVLMHDGSDIRTILLGDVRDRWDHGIHAWRAAQGLEDPLPTPAERDLKQAVERDRWLMEDLVSLRFAHGLSVEDVSERMGIPVEAVQHLESPEADPHLSTVRRYALVVGARIKHAVWAPVQNENREAS